MLPNRIRISKSATDTLKLFKARTGIPPNVACRLALTLSLESGKQFTRRRTNLEGSEFNMPTLLGDHAAIYECLIRQIHGNLDLREIAPVMAAHIDNGLEKLKRCKSLLDAAECLGLLS